MEQGRTTLPPGLMDRLEKSLTEMQLTAVLAYCLPESKAKGVWAKSLRAAGYKETLISTHGAEYRRKKHIAAGIELVNTHLIALAIHDNEPVIETPKDSDETAAVKLHCKEVLEFELASCFEEVVWQEKDAAGNLITRRELQIAPISNINTRPLQSLKVMHTQKGQTVEFRLPDKNAAGRLLAQLEGALEGDGVPKNPPAVNIYLGGGAPGVQVSGKPQPKDITLEAQDGS